MFRGFQLPTQKGIELFPTVMQAPPVVRVTIDASDDWWRDNHHIADAVALQVMDQHAGELQQFVVGQRHAVALSIVEYTRVQASRPDIMITYMNHQGVEIISVVVRPEAAEGMPKTRTIDAADTWLIGTDILDWPFDWSAGASTELTLMNLAYYTPSNPEKAHGSGVYTKALKGRQYWEVEIVTLPTQTPPNLVTFLGGVDDGTWNSSLIEYLSATEQVERWPPELNTYLQPVIGVAPEGFIDLTTHQPLKAHTANMLGHGVFPIGDAGAVLRSIGVVRTSIVSGVPERNAWVPGGYYAHWVATDDPSSTFPTQDSKICDDNPVFGRNPLLEPLPEKSIFYPNNGGFGASIIGRQDTVYVCMRGGDNGGGPTHWSGTSTTWPDPGVIYYPAGNPDAGLCDTAGPTFTHGAWSIWSASGPPGNYYFVWQNASWDKPRRVGTDFWYRQHAIGSPYQDWADIVHIPSTFKTLFSPIAYYGDRLMPFYNVDGRHGVVVKGEFGNIDNLDEPSPEGTGPRRGVWTGIDLGALVKGDVVMIATDTKTRKIWFGKNGKWFSVSGALAQFQSDQYATHMDGDAEVKYYPTCSYRLGKTWVKMRFGAAQKYGPPAGFDRLGASSIDVPA